MPEKIAFPIRESLWVPLAIDPLATARGQGPSYQVIARPGRRERREGAGPGGDAAATRTRLRRPTRDRRGRDASARILGPRFYALL